MYVSPETFSAIQDQLWDDEVRRYSGRGMYGKEGLAIVSDGSAWGIQTELRKLRDEIDSLYQDIEEPFGSIIEVLDYMFEHEPRIDSMGLSTVYYWPSLELDEEVED